MFIFKIGKRKIFAIVWNFKEFHCKRNPVHKKKEEKK